MGTMWEWDELCLTPRALSCSDLAVSLPTPTSQTKDSLHPVSAWGVLVAAPPPGS